MKKSKKILVITSSIILFLVVIGVILLVIYGFPSQQIVSPPNSNILTTAILESQDNQKATYSFSFGGDTAPKPGCSKDSIWNIEYNPGEHLETSTAQPELADNLILNKEFIARNVMINSLTVEAGDGCGGTYPPVHLEYDYLNSTCKINDAGTLNNIQKAKVTCTFKINVKVLQDSDNSPSSGKVYGLSSGSLKIDFPKKQCEINSDCPQGKECKENICVLIPIQPCISNSDCLQDEQCKDGICIPKEPINWDLIIGISVAIVLLISIILLAVIFRRKKR